MVDGDNFENWLKNRREKKQEQTLLLSEREKTQRQNTYIMQISELRIIQEKAQRAAAAARRVRS